MHLSIADPQVEFLSGGQLSDTLQNFPIGIPGHRISPAEYSQRAERV